MRIYLLYFHFAVENELFNVNRKYRADNFYQQKPNLFLYKKIYRAIFIFKPFIDKNRKTENCFSEIVIFSFQKRSFLSYVYIHICITYADMVITYANVIISHKYDSLPCTDCLQASHDVVICHFPHMT